MLSILIFFAFNISMRVYMNRMALNEIDSSRDTVKALLRNELASLFKRFAKDVNGQHGVGLSIASAAAEQLGGHLSAHNLEQGAVFILSLPHRFS